MTELDFIRMMQRDGWLALNASGDVVKNPRTASRQWEHSRTRQIFNGEHTDVIDGESVPVWKTFYNSRNTRSVQMEFNDYMSDALETAVYPNIGNNLPYAVLGLTNEAGEVAGKLKKIIRDKGGNLGNDEKYQIAHELGDVLWYVAACCNEIGFSMNHIARINLDKLQSRRERGVIKGSGDKR